MARNTNLEDQPWFQRLVEEQKELDSKTKKLYNFIQENPMFHELNEVDQDLMNLQLKHMVSYLDVLTERIIVHYQRENEQ